MHNSCWGKFVHLENLLFILCKWGGAKNKCCISIRQLSTDVSKPQWATELFKLITPEQTIKIGQQYVGPSFSYNPHYSFVAKRIASLPKEGRFSHTLLVTITLVSCFLCGLIHYDEADVTVWKRSIVGVMRSTECSSQGVGVAEVPPTERVDEFYIISQSVLLRQTL